METKALTQLNFGKYKGRTIADVVQSDPKYVKWILDNPKVMQEGLKEAIIKLNSKEKAMADEKALPVELVEQLLKGRENKHDETLELLQALGGKADMDTLLIQSWEKTGKVTKRNTMTSRLYSMEKAGLITKSKGSRPTIFSVA